jgi:hypothetical protein
LAAARPAEFCFEADVWHKFHTISVLTGQLIQAKSRCNAVNLGHQQQLSQQTNAAGMALISMITCRDKAGTTTTDIQDIAWPQASKFEEVGRELPVMFG